MSEKETEQKIDQPAFPSDSPAVKAEGQFTSVDKQDIHTLATAANKVTQKDSATMESLSDERIAEIKAKGGFQKFEITGLSGDENVVVHEKRASQAIEPPPPVNLTDPEFHSAVRLNIQVTNVPEVSQPLTAEEVLQHISQVFESGAQTVRPVTSYLSQPNAINNDLSQLSGAVLNHLSQADAINSDIMTLANHFALSPDQLNQDIGSFVSPFLDQIDHPLEPNERATLAGMLMPLFCFEGNAKEPIDPNTVKQMGIEGMTDTQLQSLGIRKFSDAGEFSMPEIPESLKHLEIQKASPELIDAIRAKGRTVIIAEPGSPVYLKLQSIGAVGAADGMYIELKQGGTKIAALEEYLHGTQFKLGLIDDLPREIAEVHVKDFMLRHPSLLGLTKNDLLVIEELKRIEIEKALLRGFKWTGR